MRRWNMIALGLALCISISLIGCGIGNSQSGGYDSNTKNLGENRDKDTIYCFDDTVIATEGYEEATVKNALTEFSIRLFEKNIEKQKQISENILISPTSVITALGMTTFGARGETLSQMEETLGVESGYLNNYNSLNLKNTSEELKLANSIWFTNDERLTVKPEFLQFNEEFYGADIYETAFDDATVKSINHWVEENTDGMIRDILDEIPQDAVMYLINALTFEAEWEETYDSTQIWKEAGFTTSDGKLQKVDMMRSEESLYLEDEAAKGFIKYYKDRNYAFAALLPDENMGIRDYVKTLSGEHLQEMLDNPQEATISVHIPQFSYEYDIEMSKLLAEMGMTDAFAGDKADFTNMATSTRGNIYINRVLHKTFIEVSPVGTKAGAATIVEATDECAPIFDDIKEVHLNRPFIYMIIDCDSNMPVFMGVVNSVK